MRGFHGQKFKKNIIHVPIIIIKNNKKLFMSQCNKFSRSFYFNTYHDYTHI